jgi:uncharacterized Fe-S cluster-containing radical SAM superfamily enzyme
MWIKVGEPRVHEDALTGKSVTTQQIMTAVDGKGNPPEFPVLEAIVKHASGAKIIEFPTLGALKAYELSEDMRSSTSEYRVKKSVLYLDGAGELIAN